METTSVGRDDDAVLRRGASKEDAAEAGTARLRDHALYFESKQRILDLLRTFSEHGFLGLDEVAEAMGRSSELARPTDLLILRARIRELEEAVRAERLANALAAWELEEAGRALDGERELVKESLVRIASLEGQLKEARRTTLKLIAASRNGLATLKRVRDHLAAETYAAGALTPLVHDFETLTEVVQELHVLALVKASTAPVEPVAPDATSPPRP